MLIFFLHAGQHRKKLIGNQERGTYGKNLPRRSPTRNGARRLRKEGGERVSTLLPLYKAAGAPAQPGIESGICRLCSAAGVGLPAATWIKDTFTDHDKLWPGEIVCHACQFACEEQSVLLQERVGKDKLQKMRNYSHFVLNGQWHPLSKGNKREMLEILMQGPDLACIAESGQKHILFRVRPGWWQLEEQSLVPCPALLTEILGIASQLYEAGAGKAEIESGRYSPFALSKVGIKLFKSCEPQLRQWRGGLPFRLALFLLQKQEDSDGR